MRALTFGLVSLASPAFGWGMFGHQITATIAQIYLLPSTRQAICSILPPTYKCNLVGVAAWPDEIKQDQSYKSYSNLHFVNAVDDDPPKKCVFDHGWKDERNILKAIVGEARNVLATGGPAADRDRSLRFLVHFLGDIHQPFHLTGKYLGGNNVEVRWKSRNTNLHAVWDSSFIDHQVLFVNTSQYTNVLPTVPSMNISPLEATRNQHIEAALAGLNYDPYIRYILLEGIYNRWTEEAKQWATCPRTDNMNPAVDFQSIMDNNSRFQDPTDLPTVCPAHWATQIHPLLCRSIWPNGLTDKTEREELSGSYATAIRDALIVEKQLAMGGVRLAVVLDGMFGSAEDRVRYGVVPLFT
ncbi:unnamed protein product [Rhizoctonia solani]|uniref:Endonuclease 3 n=1 Tax=Rhizoctonia solani TaxID=456999 RepID=A0A8H3C8L5_9AGAM|nr:unnamed protein product [Rhizoctonia solani]